jgi:A/G-specific adenine glycosylase
MSKAFETGLRQLAGWFQRQQRILPWRENPDTYRVWISEIMLQQTQVVTVIPYFEKFIARFPNLETLAEAPLEDVLLHWAGLGYYSRARNIHRAAQMIQAAGKFPQDREGWLEIPGVGNYTAGAILSISLNQPEAILDGNVERVISRVKRVKLGEVPAHYKEQLWKHSRLFVERAHDMGIAPRVTNQALMELGATLCSPKNPKCLLCPLSSFCEAHRNSEEDQFPPKKKPKQWIDVKEELHCFINSEGRVLLRQRNAGEWRAGLWDLLAEAPALKYAYIGEIKSKHIVTRHKISRTTKIWKAKVGSKSALGNTSAVKSRGTIDRGKVASGKSQLLTAAESGFVSEFSKSKKTETESQLRWILPESPDVAIGSALKKTLSQIRETFPEVWPAS